MIIAKEGGQFEQCPCGPVQAVVTNVYDLGTQKQNGVYGETVSPQVVIMWETAHVITSGKFAGKRFVLSKTYTNSMGLKSNLYRDLRSMIGDKAQPGIDLEKLRGYNVLLNVQENSKGYATIVSIMPCADNVQKLIPELQKTNVPEWVQKKIAMQIRDEQSSGFYEEGSPAENAPEPINWEGF